MEPNKLLAILLPTIAIVMFAVINSFLGKSEPSKRQKQVSFAVAVTGITIMIVVAFIIL